MEKNFETKKRFWSDIFYAHYNQTTEIAVKNLIEKRVTCEKGAEELVRYIESIKRIILCVLAVHEKSEDAGLDGTVPMPNT